MDRNLEKELIGHCFEHMTSKECAQTYLKTKGINYRKQDTFEKLAQKAQEAFDENKGVSLSDVCDFFRNTWSKDNTEKVFDFHIKNLKSGLLNGHDWHGTMPSFLHRGMQDRVRECCPCSVGLSLEKLIEYGADIMKQEYFIVATHDIIEYSIIKNIDTVIPEIGGRKSISDFIIKNVPVDLKVSHFTKRNIGPMTKNEKIDYAKSLYQNADSERRRKQAAKALHNWGLNRMYVLYNDSELWLREPESIIKSVVEQLSEPEILNIQIDEGAVISAIVVEV